MQPQADERILGRQGYGLIQLIHGHGKGKTTAALGQAIRCAGSGRRVAIIYFDKGGSDHYFERLMLDKIDLTQKLERPIDVLHLGTCMKLAMETAACPIDFDELKTILENKVGVKVVLGTHSY